MYWVAGLHYNNVFHSNYIFVDDIVLTQDNLIPQQLTENFEGHALDDLLPQDANWSQEVNPLLTASSLEVVGGQRMYMSATAPKGTGETRNTAYRDLAPLGTVTEDLVTISFNMEHTFPGLFHGKISGMAFVSSTKGTMFEMMLFDTPSAFINNTAFPYPAYGSHDYQFHLDFSSDTFTFSIDDNNPYGPYAMMGSGDWTPADFVSTTPNSGLAWICGLHYTNNTHSNTLYVDDIIVEQEAGGGPFQVGADVRSLAIGRSLFNEPDDHIRWNDAVIPDINCFVAVTGLNRVEPLVVTNANAGYLYALLWRWDFGIVAHDWSPIPSLHGWTLVEADGGEVLNFFAPVSPLPLYRRPISAGTHNVNVTEDFGGQWILVGFVEDATAVGTTDLSTAQLAGGATKYNVFDPGESVQVNSADTIFAMRLCQNHEPNQVVTVNPFLAPERSGRYWLELDFANGTRIMPLTVGLGAPDHAGWHGDDFFPIHFYGAGAGQHNVNPDLAADMSVLAQFDLGVNTFFVNRNDTQGMMDTSLIDALGCRRLYNTVNYSRYYIRDVADDNQAVEGVMWSLELFDAEAENAIGFYIEDEPPVDTAARMALIEFRFASDYAGTDLPLLYCLNHGNLTYWQGANTTTGSFRAYPFYESEIGDIPAMQQQVDDKLLTGIDNWRSFKPNDPLWLTTQAFGDPTWAVPTAEQVRVQVNLALARGVDALTHFGWAYEQVLVKGVSLWPYIPVDDRYAELGALHAKIDALELHKWSWVMNVPQADPDFDVQVLTNAQGGPVAWITNRDWTTVSNGTVDLPGFSEPHAVSLDPGDSEIVSLCPDLTADLDGDCRVNPADLAILSDDWVDPAGLSADIDGDGDINLIDFSRLAKQWLQSVTIP